jgi:S-adenosylmethionine hydrolase
MITITSDIGYKDYAIAQLKAKMLSLHSTAIIVDITHQIEPFNYNQAAYILGNAYHHFPEKSIHIVAIDTEIYKKTNHLIVLYNNHIFIGSNNGIISNIIQGNKAEKIIEIPHEHKIYTQYNDFDALGVFAILIEKGENIENFGNETTDIKLIIQEKPFFDLNKKYCVVKLIFKDNFGNLVFNITQKQLEDFANGRQIEIQINKKDEENQHKSKFNIKIFKKYSDIALKSEFDLSNYEGNLLAIFNEAGYFQISLFRSNPEVMGTVQSLLGLNYNDTINIKFQ